MPPEQRQRYVLDTLINKAKLHMDPVARSFGLNLEHKPEMCRCVCGGWGDGLEENGNGSSSPSQS